MRPAIEWRVGAARGAKPTAAAAPTAPRIPAASDPHITPPTDLATPVGVVAAPTARRRLTGRQRAGRAGGLGAALALTAYVGLVDPAGGGAFPPCPSRALFGIDCPACGGLRGTHDLLHGDVVQALDHNLLLPVLLGVAGVALALWLLPALGRRAPTISPPRWALVAIALVAAAFTVLRNLPVAGLEFLASGA